MSEKKEVQSLKKRIKELENTIATINNDDEEYYKILENFYRITRNNNAIYSINDFDLNCKFNYISSSVINLSGYKPKELIGKSFFQYIHPDDKKTIVLPLLKTYLRYKANNLLKGELKDNSRTFVYRFKVKAGNWRYAETTSNLIGNKLVNITTDVGDKKDFEIKLQRTEIDHKILLDNLNDIYYRINKEGIITDINPIVEKISGHSPNEIIGKHVKTLFNNQKNRYDFINAIKKFGIVKNYEFILSTKTGNDLYISANAYILKDEDGNPIGIEGILQNNTNQKLAEKASLESRDNMAFLADSAMELHQFNNKKQVYEYAANKLYKLMEDDGLLSIVDFNVEDNTWEMSSIKGISPFIKEATKILGFDLRKMKGKREAKYYKYIKDGTLTKIKFNINEFTHGIVPKKSNNAFVNLFKIKDIYCISIKKDKNILGNISFFTTLNTKKLNKQLIEAFISQVSIVLEKIKANEALQVSERRLAMAVEGASLGLWDQDFISGKIMRNERWAQMLGYESHEIEQNRSAWRQLIHPDDLAQSNIITKLHEQEKTSNYSIEHRMRTKEGKWKWIHNWGRIVERDKHGKPLRAIGVHLDISGRKQAEIRIKETFENLRKSEKQLRLITENTTDNISITTFDLKATYIYVNPSVKHVLDYEPEELIGKSFFDFIHPEDKKALLPLLKNYLKQKIKKLLSGKKSTISELIEFRFRNKAGEWRNMQCTVNIADKQLLAVTRDITEQKQLEDNLRKNENFLNDIIESVQDGISILNPDLTIKHVNGIMNNWYKANLPLEGKKCYEVYHNADNPCDPCPSLRSLKSGKTELNIVRGLPGSSIEWIELYSYPIKDPNSGKVTGIAEFVHDITERRQTEQELKKSKEQAESYLNIAARIIIALDKEGIITLLNDNGHKLLGYKTGELIGKNWFDICIPISKNIATHNAFNQLVIGDIENVTNFENNVVTKDGVEKTIFWHNTLIYDDENKISGLLSSGEDISERKKIELELKKLSTSVEQSPVSIVITDTNGNIEYVNPYFEKLTGYSLSEAINQNPRVLKSGLTPDHVFKDLWSTIKNGKVWSGELINKKKNGDIYTEEAAIAPVFNENGVITQYTAVKTNITERKQAEHFLVESEEKFRLIYETSGNGIMTLEPPDWKFTSGNNKILEIFQVKNEKEFLSRSPWDFSPKYQPDGQLSIVKAKEMIDTAMRDGENFFEWKHKRIKGEEFFATVLLNKVEIGNRIFLQARVNDINNKKILELELQQSRKLFQDLYDKAPDMYFSIDMKDKIISVNQNGAEYLGYKKEQLIGNNVWMVVHKDDIPDIKEQLKKISSMNGDKIYELEFRKVKKDGTIIFVHEQIQCICDDSEKPKELRIVCRDITEINKNKQKILDYQNNLKLMTHELSRIEEREKRELAYKLHDVIGQSMAMAKIKLGEISKDMSFEDIQNNIDLAKSLVVDAIKKSRDLTYELSPPILHELGLVAAIEWYSSQISKLYDIIIYVKGIKESLGCSEQNKIIIYRSITELLNNIVKYSKASKAVITINKFNSHGRIVVKDNGIGFKNKDISNPTASKQFGLFSIKERIEYIGGEFNIKSTINKGTTATIKIAIEK